MVAPGEDLVQVVVRRWTQHEAVRGARPQVGSGHAGMPIIVNGATACGTLTAVTDTAEAPASAVSPFVAGLPKAELHVHHVGSASPRIVAGLAARHEGRSPVPADPAALADYFAFRDFAHFIEIYLSVVDLI